MNTESIKNELHQLISSGTEIRYVGAYAAKIRNFTAEEEKLLQQLSEKFKNYKESYHVWYAAAYRVIRTFAPERLEEFEELYRGKKNSKELNYLSAGITHHLQGIVSSRYGGEDQDYFSKFYNGLEQQTHILQSVHDNMGKVLFNLENEIHYSVFRSEIEASKALAKLSQLRAAGALAGVTIEEHLKLTCKNRGIKLGKKNPSISDYNDALKNDMIIDTITWRLITRCGDIRNYSVHSKEREPADDEIADIIRAAEKIISEVS